RPAVAGGGDQRAAAVAPELILHLSHRTWGDRRARARRLAEQRVGVLRVNPQADRRSADLLRSLPAAHRVVQEDDRIADAEFGVHDLAVGADGAALFFGAESLPVPVDRVRRIVEDQMRRDGMESFWNCTLCLGHYCLLPIN